ncbi:kinase-like domain-containing protein [Mycena capillaripes]|nr:kinase-like domain-containing protein [Mycena capillaripes]
MIQIIHDKILDYSGLPEIPAVIVGAKADLNCYSYRESRRQVSLKDVEQLAARWHKAAWIETSALHNVNVDKAFTLCLGEIEKRNVQPVHRHGEPRNFETSESSILASILHRFSWHSILMLKPSSKSMPESTAESPQNRVGQTSFDSAAIQNTESSRKLIQNRPRINFALNTLTSPNIRDVRVRAMTERLDKLFQAKESYEKFLACRGTSAQELLDLLQDLLDYESTLTRRHRRRFFKALIRLSKCSKIHPQCFTLTGLEQGKLVAGGSFGDVYKGWLEGQSVAVKMMRVFEGSDIDALLKEFGQEALIWRQLCHPNLLPFYGLHYFQERLCLVSPWMENGHVTAFLKKNTCNNGRLLSLILDVALGLEHLHQKGVVHGDLKGDNIFITPSGRACIADFGLSSIITGTSSIQLASSSRAQGGTIRYQAPELHQGEPNGLCSDTYGFACVVNEMLTGKPPFPELRMDAAVIKAVSEGRRPTRPISCSGTPLFDGLWNLLQDCWAEQPVIRPTAVQIVERLTGADIRATTMQSAADWDERSTSKFRRQSRAQRPLPSDVEFERMISGDVLKNETPVWEGYASSSC